MAFSENQLSVWANQGATVSSANTYNSIKNCIDGNSWTKGISYDTYLQGSYRNTTNIRGDSDVDIVVELKSTFYSNKLELPADQLKEYNEFHSIADYTIDDFREEIIKRLQDYYGTQNVDVGNKSIKVLGNSNRLDCDVVCCAEYREHKNFSKLNPSNYAKGIVFYTTHTNEKVVNFPKLHYKNGVNKNKNSYSNYKPSIRIIKNMRSRMVDEKLIDSNLAPSYFIECLLYNLPNVDYQSPYYYNNILAILNSLYAYDESDLGKFVCQNFQRYLFGNSDQQWDTKDSIEFIQQIIKFWNNG